MSARLLNNSKSLTSFLDSTREESAMTRHSRSPRDSRVDFAINLRCEGFHSLQLTDDNRHQFKCVANLWCLIEVRFEIDREADPSGLAALLPTALRVSCSRFECGVCVYCALLSPISNSSSSAKSKGPSQVGRVRRKDCRSLPERTVSH